MYQMFRNQFLSFSMYQSKCCHVYRDRGLGLRLASGAERACPAP